MPTMQERFVALFPGRPLSKVEAAFDRLAAYYEAVGRYYHTLFGHIQDGLEAQELFFPDMSHEGLLAFWFHDAVYDPKRTDNETRSATLAYEMLVELGEPESVAARVAQLIRTTERHEPTDLEGMMVCDLDLLSLAIRSREYEANTARIRKEYSWVTDEQWKAGRLAFIERFLSRRIYSLMSPRVIFCAQSNLRKEELDIKKGVMPSTELPATRTRLLDAFGIGQVNSTWNYSSACDPRWNCSGRGVTIRDYCPSDQAMTRRAVLYTLYGTPPEDLEFLQLVDFWPERR